MTPKPRRVHAMRRAVSEKSILLQREVIFVVGEDKVKVKASHLGGNAYFTDLVISAAGRLKSDELLIISLPHIRFSVLLEVLRYLQTGKANITETNMLDIFAAAEQYKISTLRTQCEAFIKHNITKQNCVHVLQYSLVHNLGWENSLEQIKYLIEQFTEERFREAYEQRYREAAIWILDHSKLIQQFPYAIRLPVQNGDVELATLMLRRGAHTAVNPEILHLAVQSGSIQTVTLLLEAAARKEAAIITPGTLHQAIRSGSEEMVNLLLDKGAGGILIDHEALLLAVKSDHRKIIKLLFQHGADELVALPAGVACSITVPSVALAAELLQAAVAHSSHKVVRLFLAHGAGKLSNIVYRRTSPLRLAVERGDAEIVRLLIEHGGADVNMAVPDSADASDAEASTIDPTIGETPLHIAAGKGNFEVTRMLLQHGAKFSALTRNTRRTPLHYAMERGDWTVAKLLIDQGAPLVGSDAALCDAKGMLPLDLAASSGKKELVMTAVRYVAERVSTGRLDLFLWACRREYYDIMKFLASGGGAGGSDSAADVNIVRAVRDQMTGATPLHWAAKRGRVAAAKFLISRGADVNAPDRDGATPLHYAARAGEPKLVKLLLEHGAEVEAWDSFGMTPLHAAQQAVDECRQRRQSLIAGDVTTAMCAERLETLEILEEHSCAHS